MSLRKKIAELQKLLEGQPDCQDFNSASLIKSADGLINKVQTIITKKAEKEAQLQAKAKAKAEKEAAKQAAAKAKREKELREAEEEATRLAPYRQALTSFISADDDQAKQMVETMREDIFKGLCELLKIKVTAKSKKANLIKSLMKKRKEIKPHTL